MKEAIKVQSVTIIIINGISESFQSVRWAMQEMEAIPAVGGRFLLGNNMAGAVCGPQGSGERSFCRERVRKNGLGTGGTGGPSTQAGRCRVVCKGVCPSGASRGQLTTSTHFGHQSQVHPWLFCWFFLLGHILQGLPKISAHSSLHKQRLSSPTPIGQAPGQAPEFRQEKTQSFSAKASEAGGGNTPGLSFDTGNSSSEKPKGEQRA